MGQALRMTRHRRIVVWAWIAAVVAAGIFPPWAQNGYSLGYRLLFTPALYARTHIDSSRLMVEWVLISILALGCFLAWPERIGWRLRANAANGSKISSEQQKWGWMPGDDELLPQFRNAVKIVRGLPDELIQTALENHGVGGLVQRVQGRLGIDDWDLHERAVKCAQSGDLTGARGLIVVALEHAAAIIEYLQKVPGTQKEAKTQ
jgi:hypothetical protein